MEHASVSFSRVVDRMATLVKVRESLKHFDASKLLAYDDLREYVDEQFPDLPIDDANSAVLTHLKTRSGQ